MEKSEDSWQILYVLFRPLSHDKGIIRKLKVRYINLVFANFYASKQIFIFSFSKCNVKSFYR